jgi:ORF6N domain
MAKSIKRINVVADEEIVSKIYFIRGQKVMLDKDLAAMFNVTTGHLNRAVKRQAKRFPDDFMFQLTKEEFDDLICQIGISRSAVSREDSGDVNIRSAKTGWGGTRKMPYAFPEQGVSMLSGVLNSDIAIEVHIRIIRIFTRLREMLLTHKDILLKLEQLERKVTGNSEDIQHIFAALKKLLAPAPFKPRNPVGFKLTGKKKKG